MFTSSEEMDTDEGGLVKKFMFVNRKAPYGTIYALEGLEVVLISAAFEQDVSMAFIDDGIYELKKGQDTKALDQKNFSPTYRALEGYDIEKLYVDRTSMESRGLTDDEFEIIKTHPVKGWEMPKLSADVGEVALDVCRHHHERVDGKGYPDGLSGDALTLCARMGAVCDVYDAITSNRSYKEGWHPAESIRKMVEWRDGHFDERVFQAFVKTVGIYPAGSLVRLRSGRLGVVVEQTEKSLLTPMVKVFFSTKSNVRIVPEDIDLTRTEDGIIDVEDPAAWGFDLNKMFGL